MPTLRLMHVPPALMTRVRRYARTVGLEISAAGAQLGASGRTTGHDLSGQPLLALDAATVRGAGYDPTTIVCEQPGCGRKVAS